MCIRDSFNGAPVIASAAVERQDKASAAQASKLGEAAKPLVSRQATMSLRSGCVKNSHAVASALAGERDKASGAKTRQKGFAK